MSASIPSASRPLITAVAVVLAVTAIAWGALALKNVHDDASGMGWLREHASVASYSVIDLGEVGRDGYADAAWVDVPGQPSAFVDLSRSQAQVRAVGDRILARVDEREAPALAGGLPADVVSSGVGFRYVGPGVVVAFGLLLLGGGVVAGRSVAPSRRDPEPVGPAR